MGNLNSTDGGSSRRHVNERLNLPRSSDANAHVIFKRNQLQEVNGPPDKMVVELPIVPDEEIKDGWSLLVPPVTAYISYRGMGAGVLIGVKIERIRLRSGKIVSRRKFVGYKMHPMTAEQLNPVVELRAIPERFNGKQRVFEAPCAIEGFFPQEDKLMFVTNKGTRFELPLSECKRSDRADIVQALAMLRKDYPSLTTNLAFISKMETLTNRNAAKSGTPLQTFVDRNQTTLVASENASSIYAEAKKRFDADKFQSSTPSDSNQARLPAAKLADINEDQGEGDEEEEEDEEETPEYAPTAFKFNTMTPHGSTTPPFYSSAWSSDDADAQLRQVRRVVIY